MGAPTLGLQPLGALAPEAGPDWSAPSLDRGAALADPMRYQVVDYLRRCPLFLAWMEYTEDQIDGRFQVAGGSGIQSDGVYYWRVDAADYVREYGIPIPAAALTRIEESGGIVPSFDRDEYARIFRELDRLVGSSAMAWRP